MPAPVDHPVETLPGIGPKTARLLEKRGYRTVGDLLLCLPRRYEDRRDVTPIPQLEPGLTVVTEGIVAHVKTYRKRVEVRLEPVESTQPGRYGMLRLVWFHALPGIAKSYQEGSRVRVTGKVGEHRGVLTIAHPELIRDGKDAEVAIVPRYPDIAGVPTKSLRRAIQAASQRAAESVPELLEPGALADGLPSLGRALQQLHCPAVDLTDDALSSLNEHRSSAHRRLAFEELFLWELSLRYRREQERGSEAPSLVAREAWAKLTEVLPFELTEAQHRTAKEICADLEGAKPMRRLLQGDVGSGKTAVALIAAGHAAAAGAQVAFLAPTELLAEQHYSTLAPLSEKLGLRTVSLVGSQSNQERRRLRDRLMTGAVDLVIGTHALLNEKVSFHRLGLVIVDEQHRFGVGQRLRLVSGKQRQTPHLLVMTATPIPRSLALVLYAGLDVSVLDEMPPGRTPATTRMYPEAQRTEAWRQLERALAADGRAYVVCPAIEVGDDLRSVEEVHSELCAHFGASIVGKVHGRVDGNARQEVMKAFSWGEVKVLVATTVIEVGVDVPEANVILIEQAERFGLAQLHQLRGRVGRAGQRSACLLLHGELTEDARLRLETLCATSDGFQVSERDLEIRGPGHLFGLRQSGAGALQFADLRRDLTLLDQAAAHAEQVITQDPTLEAPEHVQMKGALDRLLAQEVVREEAG